MGPPLRECPPGAAEGTPGSPQNPGRGCGSLPLLPAEPGCPLPGTRLPPEPASQAALTFWGVFCLDARQEAFDEDAPVSRAPGTESPLTHVSGETPRAIASEDQASRAKPPPPYQTVPRTDPHHSAGCSDSGLLSSGPRTLQGPEPSLWDVCTLPEAHRWAGVLGGKLPRALTAPHHSDLLLAEGEVPGPPMMVLSGQESGLIAHLGDPGRGRFCPGPSQPPPGGAASVPPSPRRLRAAAHGLQVYMVHKVRLGGRPAPRHPTQMVGSGDAPGGRPHRGHTQGRRPSPCSRH